jgi:hypothetical protein
MTTTTTHSWLTKRFGTMIAGALLVAVAAPSYAAPRAPGSCGPAAKLGQITDQRLRDRRVRSQGWSDLGRPAQSLLLRDDRYRRGGPVTICEEIAQNIDMIVVNPEQTMPTTQTWTPPFGQPSRFAPR